MATMLFDFHLNVFPMFCGPFFGICIFIFLYLSVSFQVRVHSNPMDICVLQSKRRLWMCVCDAKFTGCNTWHKRCQHPAQWKPPFAHRLPVGTECRRWKDWILVKWNIWQFCMVIFINIYWDSGRFCELQIIFLGQLATRQRPQLGIVQYK